MKTASVDTNVLLRALIESDQTLAARQLLGRPGCLFAVSHIVIAELVYVLGHHYRLNRPETAQATRRLLAVPSIVCDHEVILAALNAFEAHPKLSFEACLLAEQASASNAIPLWTFDAKLARQHPAAALVP